MKLAAFVAFVVAAVPMSAAIYYAHRDLNEHPELTAADHIGGFSTIGDDRAELLRKLTLGYVAHHANASSAMRQGTALAPTDYLNQQLEAEGEKWRIRNVRGVVAETYDIT